MKQTTCLLLVPRLKNCSFTTFPHTLYLLLLITRVVLPYYLTLCSWCIVIQKPTVTFSYILCYCPAAVTIQSQTSSSWGWRLRATPENQYQTPNWRRFYSPSSWLRLHASRLRGYVIYCGVCMDRHFAPSKWYRVQNVKTNLDCFYTNVTKLIDIIIIKLSEFYSR
jgi:hypothetical protein